MISVYLLSLLVISLSQGSSVQNETSRDHSIELTFAFAPSQDKFAFRHNDIIALISSVDLADEGETIHEQYNSN